MKQSHSLANTGGTTQDLAARLHALPFGARLLTLASVFIFIVSGSLIALKTVDNNFFVSVPREGGTLNEGILGRPHMINPVLAKNDADRDIASLIYSGLFRVNGDNIAPDLASNMQISEDGKTYTITLKDAKFHDGTIVTAADVVYTVGLIQNKVLKSPLATNFLGVKVDAGDAKTVTFTLDSPLATFPDALTFGILPMHLWKNIKLEDIEDTNLPLHPIGSGPYKFKSLTRTGEASLLDSYNLEAWGEGSREKPLIQNIHFVFFGNDGDRVEALNSGRIDSAAGFDPEAMSKIDSSKVASTSAKMLRIFGVYFNQQKNPVLADPIVRQALDVSIPRTAITHKVFANMASPENVAFPGLSHDIASDDSGELAAKVLLEQNGWTRGTDGIYAKETKRGQPLVRLAFTLVTPEDVPTEVAAADITAETWKKMGIAVERQSQGSDTFSQNVLVPRNFDALFYGEVTGRNPDPYAFWHSKEKRGANIAQYNSKTTDTLIETLAKTTDPASRTDQLAAIATAIASDRPAIFAYSPKFVYLTDPRIHGVTLPEVTTSSDRFASIEKWYIEDERVWKWFTK